MRPPEPTSRLLLLGVWLGSCAHRPPPGGQDLAGTWRAVLETPGGELPFTLRIAPAGAAAPAVAVNGAEEVPFTSFAREGARVVFAIEGYDSGIEAVLSRDGRRMEGEWSRQAGKERARLRFTAFRGDGRRFVDEPGRGAECRGDPAAVPSVAGSWSARFEDEEGSEPARGEFTQDGVRVTGTFLTPTGDDRFLEGEYRGGCLRLSAFDGSHAFLFHASARPDGSLAGDFWSRDSYHATWAARRAPPRRAGAEPEDDALPDAFGLTSLKNREGKLSFSFPDLDGRTISFPGPRFAGKVVVVDVFGSWCPNCNDQAPLLAEWYRRYHARGLEIVGLAFEMTGEPGRDREYVRRYAWRHSIEYPLLLAGISDKAAASETLPDLSGVAAFPTTLFIGRDGRVRKIHTGFAGPGTGEHHRRLRAKLGSLLESLLAE